MAAKKNKDVAIVSGQLHLKKLCVGVASLQELIDWRHRHRAQTGIEAMSHTTRMWPKRAEELLAGGSLYWVVAGKLVCRQAIIGLEPVKREDHTACRIMLDDTIVETHPWPHRPFQGWRYLKAEDAPPDLLDKSLDGDETAEMPEQMRAELADLGLL